MGPVVDDAMGPVVDETSSPWQYVFIYHQVYINIMIVYSILCGIVVPLSRYLKTFYRPLCANSDT